ncbi:8140_t:CDS:2, partial [Racocetra persica]
AINIQVCNATKTTPYQLVFGQDLQADLRIISMLYQQNIVNEKNILLENQASTNQLTLKTEGSSFINDMEIITINDDSDKECNLESNNSNKTDLESNNSNENDLNSNEDQMIISRENSFTLMIQIHRQKRK